MGKAIATKFINLGKVLDTGCAAGFILKGFIESDWTGTEIGIESKYNGIIREKGIESGY